MTQVAYPELALHPRPLAGVRYPHPSLEDTYQPGVSESWIAQLVCSLLVAHGGTTVLETGGFQGITSSWLALTLEQMGGGKLYVCEIDERRGNAIEDRLATLPVPNVDHLVYRGDALAFMHGLVNDCIDLAWVDDCHEKPHVAREIEALWPRMAPGGLMVFHDVIGSVDLQEVVRRYGGYVLDLPRLGPAGGIGVIQVPQ